MNRQLLIAAVLPMVVSCAGYLPPNAHLATAMGTVQVAEDLGATKTDHSAYHVKLAHDAVAQAKVFIREGEHEKADYMTLRAYNDVELAILLVREAVARERAMRAFEKEESARRVSP